MRAFLAFELPSEIKEYLWSVVKRLSQGIDGVRWVKPEGLHITLKFFGEISRERRLEIERSLEGIEKTHNAAPVSLRAVDAFPDMRRPRVVVVTLEEGVDNTKAIFHDIEGRLAIIGIEREMRGFTPHVTLGRVKTPIALPERAKALENKRFLLDTLVLYESTLTQKGAVYRSLKELRLAQSRI